ncbi:tetraacyldisaccharide 4'-kinase [Chitinolyticbacter meiyuanensis]|uniref:tetraacyldisaccharide 4'-kinase n=1 Tax=Chitinolyticbacter meiyuanensis TaxID=682798 RepID=UPI0011E5A34F|nr:tetraacyldisaccharide 4'-kinase [Chitinolyticbacter meiyuanensis]
MQFIDRLWYCPGHPLSWLLRPLSWLFGFVGMVRRGWYRRGVFSSRRLPVPVVVIGNLTAGGTGKTPLTAYLAQALRAAGHRPGIVSRGYGGKAAAPQLVATDSDPAEVGDEPLLLARITGVPVCVHRRRAEAGQALLAAHPEVDVILCDDGLQHYALARDIEIAVVDGARGFGNGALLPAGPLREPLRRLAGVDAVVVNGVGRAAQPVDRPTFTMRLQPGRSYRLDDPALTTSAAELAGQPLTAVCGIGNPARFFATLTALGLAFTPLALPDHHRFTPSDLPAGTLIVTEKDAVKLAALPDLAAASARIWVLPVSATLEPELASWLMQRLSELVDGRETA